MAWHWWSINCETIDDPLVEDAVHIGQSSVPAQANLWASCLTEFVDACLTSFTSLSGGTGVSYWLSTNAARCRDWYFFYRLDFPCSYLIGDTIPTSLLVLVETIFIPVVSVLFTECQLHISLMRIKSLFLEHMSHIHAHFHRKHTSIRTHINMAIQIWQFMIDYTAMHYSMGGPLPDAKSMKCSGFLFSTYSKLCHLPWRPTILLRCLGEHQFPRVRCSDRRPFVRTTSLQMASHR